MVQADYGSAMNEVKRAQSDEIAAYLAWSDQEIKAENYTTAIGNLDTLLNLPYCDSSCQAQANALDATTYYKNAESELSAQQYDNAVNDFKMVLTRFPNSPQAQQLHPDLAQALLGQGQQQLATDCSSAIPTYQELSTMFGDTPAGQQGTKALKASQPVTGHFTSSIPNDPSLTVVAALLKNLNNGISSDQFFQLLNGAPTATIRSDGTFVFKPLPQGTYDLAWGTERSNGNKSFNTNYYTGSGAPFYVATVGPLCAFDFGDINETIPVTQ
jgi:tetratricopeptide (TPR) repeat protein